MKEIFERVKELRPISLGVEVETQRQIAEKIAGSGIEYGIDSFPMMSFASHPESSRILELNLVPAFLDSPQDVLITGELVRRFNPFQFIGGSDRCSGSCHCHVNIGAKEQSNSQQKAHAEVYWSMGLQAALLPFLTIGYMKDGEVYEFRDRRSGLVSGHIYTTGRGSGMMVNTSVPYARYGLEYRANENSPLWVYLIAPIIALIESDKELNDKLIKLRTAHARNSDNTTFGNNISFMKKGLDIIRPVLLTNMELITSQVEGEDNKTFLKLIMEAYLTENIHLYNEILQSVLEDNIKTKILIEYISQNFIERFNSDMLSSEYDKEKHKPFINSVYPEIVF